jgi:hypothetical protein
MGWRIIMEVKSIRQYRKERIGKGLLRDRGIGGINS